MGNYPLLYFGRSPTAVMGNWQRWTQYVEAFVPGFLSWYSACQLATNRAIQTAFSRYPPDGTANSQGTSSLLSSYCDIPRQNYHGS